MNRLIKQLLLHLGVLLLLGEVLHAILSEEFQEQELSLLLLPRSLEIWLDLASTLGGACRSLVENLSWTEVLVLLGTCMCIQV